jgi:hypothetical protein
MRTIAALATAVSLALTIAACAADASDDSNVPQGDNADQGNEQDITTAKSVLKGSWTISTDSKNMTSSVAYEFRPSGEFWRDDNRVLNGVMVKDAPPPVQRTSGTYVVNTTKKTITLHITSPINSTEVVSYDYKAGRVLNGMFLPGHEPDTRASLTLTQQPAPMSHIAFPALVFKSADSWCTADTDCKDEAKDKTWLDGAAAPAVSCDTDNRVCIAAVNGPKANRCGNTTCGEGLVCCNPLQGICTKPGEFCIQ